MTQILTRDGRAGPAYLRSADELGVEFSPALDSDSDSSTPPDFVSGRFARFDSWTEINDLHEGRFLERIAEGAFRQTIREDRAGMRILFHHGRDPFIGDRPIAPLDGIGEDGLGGFYFGRLFPTMAARELAPLLAAGVLGSSFRFSVRPGGEEWIRYPKESGHNPERLPERTIRSVKVLEVGPTPFPAYGNATAGTSTGAHPPRSATSSGLTQAEYLAFMEQINDGSWDTPGERQARDRWLDRVLPLPSGLRR